GCLWVYTSGTVRQVYHKQWKAMGMNMIFDLEAQVVETQSPTNAGDSGGPLVNDRGELVGVTQGGATGAQLLSTFIDLSEAVDFIDKSCKTNSLTGARDGKALVAGDRRRARPHQAP